MDKSTSNQIKQSINEAVLVIFLLSLNAGFIDGHTFLFNHERFVGMQTGNIIQSGLYLALGKFDIVMNFVWPIIAFMFGVIFSTILKRLYSKFPFLVFEQTSLIVQTIGTALLIAFADNISDTLLISGFSFFISLQLIAFAKMNGGSVMTILATGNTKTFATLFFTGIVDRNYEDVKTSGKYFLVILAFFIGAFFAAYLQPFWGTNSLFVSPGILVLVILIISIKKTAQ